MFHQGFLIGLFECLDLSNLSSPQILPFLYSSNVSNHSFTFKSCQSCQSLKLIHVLIHDPHIFVEGPGAPLCCQVLLCAARWSAPVWASTRSPLRSSGKSCRRTDWHREHQSWWTYFWNKKQQDVWTQAKKQQDSRWSLASTSWQIIPQRHWRHTLLWRQTCGNIKKVMKVNLELKASKGMVLL